MLCRSHCNQTKRTMDILFVLKWLVLDFAACWTMFDGPQGCKTVVLDEYFFSFLKRWKLQSPKS